MGFQWNGVDVDNVLWNGAQVEEVQWNGVLVWANEVTESISVNIGVQANIRGYANFGAVNIGSRTPPTVDGKTITGFYYNTSTNQFTMRLSGNHVGSFDFVDLDVNYASGTQNYTRASSDVPAGAYDGTNNDTLWVWSSIIVRWGLSGTYNVDVTY